MRQISLQKQAYYDLNLEYWEGIAKSLTLDESKG